MKPTGHPINVRLLGLETKVKRDAKSEGISMSAVIRRIVKRHYEANSAA